MGWAWQNREMNATGAGEARRAGSLQPAELAHAAVMAALCAATAIIAVVVPFAAGLSMLGTVPMGLLAYRYRLRVLIAAAVAGGVIAFLIAGMGGFMTVFDCAYIGGLTGIVKRRGRGTPTAFVAGVVAGGVFGLFGVGALVVLVRLRNLVFESMTANVNGLAAITPPRPRPRTRCRAAEDRLRGDARLLAGPDRRVIGVQHHASDDGRLVGFVACAVASARRPRRAQAGRRRRDRARRAGARPAERRDVPLSRSRPRRTRAGVADR